MRIIAATIAGAAVVFYAVKRRNRELTPSEKALKLVDDAQDFAAETADKAKVKVDAAAAKTKDAIKKNKKKRKK